jgi:hypothetical protein
MMQQLLVHLSLLVAVAATDAAPAPAAPPPPRACGVPSSARRDCAYRGINATDCASRGCCFDAAAAATGPLQGPGAPASCFFHADGDFHPEFLPRWHYIPRPFNWMNDPDGPFFDPIHKLYHLFVQYETPRQWAHAVSPDMLRWQQLPQGLQTDDWYDRGGVYSGSTTVLDDKDRTPVISYSVSSNDMQALAWPCNRSDPNLTDWCKFAGNPILTAPSSPHGGTAPPGRDDSTAWRSADSKSWRMVYGAFVNSTGAAVAYESKDFKSWTPIESPATAGSPCFGSGHLLFENGPTGEGAEMWCAR